MMPRIFVLAVVVLLAGCSGNELTKLKSELDVTQKRAEVAEEAVATAIKDLNSTNQLLKSERENLAEIEAEFENLKLLVGSYEKLDLTELQKQKLKKNMIIGLMKDNAAKSLTNSDSMEGVIGGLLLSAAASALENELVTTKPKTETVPQSPDHEANRPNKRKQILSSIYRLENEIVELAEEIRQCDRQIDELNDKLDLYYRSSAKRDTFTKQLIGGAAGGYVINQKNDAETNRNNAQTRLRQKRNYLTSLRTQLLDLED